MNKTENDISISKLYEQNLKSDLKDLKENSQTNIGNNKESNLNHMHKMNSTMIDSAKEFK